MQIYILLTEKCNLSCSMCIRGKQVGKDLNKESLFDITEKNDFSSHDIVITGGEPSLHKDLVDIVKHMCEKSKTVTITSNGLVGKYIEELKECDNLFYQISIDGDKEKHNQIRGVGAFEIAWDTIKKLDVMNINYSIAAVVSKKNQKEIFDLFPKLACLENMRYLRISYEMPFGSAEQEYEEMMSSEKWNSFVNMAISKANFRLKIKKIFPFKLYEQRKDELKKNTRIRSVNCGSGKNKIYVYPDFKVYPCTCLTDFCVGDLSNQMLDEILISEEMKKFSEYTLLVESECNNCEYRDFCNGGCIGMSYHYYGKLGMGDRRCPKLIGENEKNLLF